MKYKSIKVPKWAYDNAVKVHEDLLRRGMQIIPAELNEPTKCPRCGSEMKQTEGEVIYWCCTRKLKCGYRQQGASSSLGSILGLGIAALMTEMRIKNNE